MATSTLVSVSTTGARIVLGSLFVVTGISKFARLQDFRQVVRAWHVVPAPVSALIATSVAVFEIGLGVTLAAALLMPFPAIAAALLLTTFNMLMVSKLINGKTNLKCGCVNKNSHVSWTSVCRNAALIMATLAVASSNSRLAVSFLVVATAILVMTLVFDSYATRRAGESDVLRAA